MSNHSAAEELCSIEVYRPFEYPEGNRGRRPNPDWFTNLQEFLPHVVAWQKPGEIRLGVFAGKIALAAAEREELQNKLVQEMPDSFHHEELSADVLGVSVVRYNLLVAYIECDSRLKQEQQAAVDAINSHTEAALQPQETFEVVLGEVKDLNRKNDVLSQVKPLVPLQIYLKPGGVYVEGV